MKPWLVGAALILPLVSCEDAPQVVRPPSPSRVGGVFQDLPPPEGFVYRNNISDRSPTGAFRVVNQTLVGQNRKLDPAAEFIRTVYPRHGWKAEGEDSSPGRSASFVFVKGEERCTIRFNQRNRTTVDMTLHVNRKD